MATTLAMLRRRINASESRVYRLHPELLSLVASYLPREALIKATHVSHRWRTILLSSPRLWTDLNFFRREQLLPFLKRSKSAPISIFIAIPFVPDLETAYNFLAQHAKRIETLTIIGMGPHLPISLPPMPSLRELECVWDCPLANDPADRIILPAVTTFIVRGCGTLPFIVPQLTKLQVYSDARLGIDELLHFLDRFPLLEELRVGYDAGIITPPHHDPIELPRLRLYGHYTSADTDLRLLDKLSLPPSCSVVMNYKNSYSTRRGVDNPFYNPSPLDDLKRISFRMTNPQEYFVDGAVELIDASNRRVLLEAYIGRRLLDDIKGIHYVNYLINLDASTVELLCVEGPDPWELGYAKEVLFCLKGIRTLVLSDLVVASYIMALDPESGEDEDASIDFWLCPELAVLVVHAREFSDQFGEDILESLPGVARRRKDAGMPFKSISLFISRSWDEYTYGPMESCVVLERLRSCVEKLEIIMGDDAMDWDMDDYFFDGLEIRRDRQLFFSVRSA